MGGCKGMLTTEGCRLEPQPVTSHGNAANTKASSLGFRACRAMRRGKRVERGERNDAIMAADLNDGSI
ncbi:hypothetical protein JCM10599A_28360 [Paraburkholderia kururiensis]